MIDPPDAERTLRRSGRLTLEAIREAEARLAEAIDAEQRYASDVDGWSGHEAVDAQGRRSLHLSAVHGQRLEALAAEVQAADAALGAAWRTYLSQLGLNVGGR